MKKLSRAKKAVLMLTMLLSLTAAFAGNGTNPVKDVLGKFWGSECHTTMTGDEVCCSYRFWISYDCFCPSCP